MIGLFVVGICLYFIQFADARSCIQTYTGVEIAGNDLTSVAGNATSCCQACVSNSACKAYTWTSAGNGTCWLKNDTQPLATLTGATTAVLTPSANDTYSLLKTYAAPTFFNDFWFDNKNGDVFGFAQFVGNNSTAWNDGLIKYQNNQVYIGVDHTTVIPNTTYGRLSVRINSYQLYNAGVFILSMDHLPVGPVLNGTGWLGSAVWPAWWMTGPNATGANGEFDMYEGYNPNTAAYVTLHNWDPTLYGNCTLPGNFSKYYNGSNWNYGGLTQMTPLGTADAPFNQAGGGAYAMQWEHGKFVRVWTWTKPNLPADVANGSSTPNPSTWGIPNAYFPFGVNCSGEVINNDYLVFDISFCNPPISSTCENVVRTEPQAFNDTYFLINYLKVFCRPGETCLTGTYNNTGK